MNNKSLKFLTLAALTAVLFSCSTSNKLSKKSYGGGWEDNVATETIAPNAATTPTMESTDVAVTETPVATTSTSNENVVPVAKIENKATANTQTTKVVKPSFKQKIAQKIIQKKLSSVKEKGNNNVDNKVILVILAILLPWLAVLLYKGVSTEFWISLILWFLLWLPGVIYALLVVLDVI